MRLATGVVLSVVTDPDLPPPTYVSTLDGYFLLPTTFDRVFISGEDNGSSVSALDFGKAQKKPDQTLAVLGGERDALIFGAETLEFWSNSPDSSGGFPFVPIQSINIGCLAAKTIVQLDRAVGWIANDGTVRLQDGYSAKRISDHYQERKIAAVDSQSIIAFGYNDKQTGHAFLVWTCPTFCFVYNLRTGRWHEQESFGRTTWRGRCSVEWQGRTLIGDYDDGRIYEVRNDQSTEAGDPIIATCIPPIINTAPSGFVLDEVAIDMTTGFGVVGPLAQDVDPVVMLSVSEDGGMTYGAARAIRLGRAGQRILRLKDYRFGKFGQQGATLKISCSASVGRALMALYIKARPLST
jgi:hypothetical protein